MPTRMSIQREEAAQAKAGAMVVENEMDWEGKMSRKMMQVDVVHARVLYKSKSLQHSTSRGSCVSAWQTEQGERRQYARCAAAAEPAWRELGRAHRRP